MVAKFKEINSMMNTNSTVKQFVKASC